MDRSRAPTAALLLSLGWLACGAPAAESRTASAREQPPAAHPDGLRDADRPSPPSSPAPAPADLLRCELALETFELGDPGDGLPSSPVVIGDGFAVAFTRTTRDGTELLVQRVRFDGTLEPPTPIRSGVHASRPFLVGGPSATSSGGCGSLTGGASPALPSGSSGIASVAPRGVIART